MDSEGGGRFILLDDSYLMGFVNRCEGEARMLRVDFRHPQFRNGGGVASNAAEGNGSEKKDNIQIEEENDTENKEIPKLEEGHRSRAPRTPRGGGAPGP